MSLYIASTCLMRLATSHLNPSVHIITTDLTTSVIHSYKLLIQDANSTNMVLRLKVLQYFDFILAIANERHTKHLLFQHGAVESLVKCISLYKPM